MTERTVQDLILEEIRLQRSETSAGLASIRTELNSRIDKLVTQEAFAAEQRRVDDRMADLGVDIVNERETRIVNEKTVKERNDKFAANLRWLAAAIVLPVALFLANLVVIKG